MLSCAVPLSQVANVEGGRFAQLSLPPGVTGAQLLQLSTVRLSELFQGTLRASRANNEGASWVVSADAGPAHAALRSALLSSFGARDTLVVARRAARQAAVRGAAARAQRHRRGRRG